MRKERGKAAVGTKRRAGKRLYHAANMSDRTFKAALWYFVKDDTAAFAAKATGLSVNAVTALFGKLRRFFVEVGLFTDIYKGGNAEDGMPDDPTGEFEEYELRLLDFHLKRYRAKRGFGEGGSDLDHWAESHWRFDFALLIDDRGGDTVQHMMLRQLLEIIQTCGPVGKPPTNKRAGLKLCLAQLNERLRWAERNSQRFSSASLRAEIRDALES